MSSRKQKAKAGVVVEGPLLLREVQVARALREVAGALGASLELDELLELVLAKIRELVRADAAYLFILDERRQELVSRSEGGAADRIIIPLEDGPLSQVTRTGRGVRLQAGGFSERVEWEAIASSKTGAALLLPLKNNLSRTIGAALVLRHEGETCAPFSDEDEEIVSVLAKQAAVAIDNSRLLVTLIRKNQQLQQAQEQLMRRVRDLELLFELERATARAHSHEELAIAVLERLARASGAEQALLVLRTPDSSQVAEFALTRRFSQTGLRTESPAAFSTTVSPASSGPLARVLSEGVPLQMDAALGEDRGLGRGREEERIVDSVRIRSMIAEPLEGEQRPMGAIGLLNKQDGPFTAEDLGLLRLVAANVATAVRLFDASRAREQEERLSAIGTLLSQVLHDLRSPLAAISGYVELMTEASDKSDRERYAAQILKQFETLGLMQQEVLAFARGETKVLVRKVLLDRFLSDLKELLERELAGKNVELRFEHQRKVVAYFDSERMTRALVNLVRNAADAIGNRGGTITVETTTSGQDLLFRVRDTGPGVPPHVATRLFESFVTSGKQGGTGLGLAIVRRIATEHGGSVELEETKSGASFLIRLPDALQKKRS